MKQDLSQNSRGFVETIREMWNSSVYDRLALVGTGASLAGGAVTAAVAGGISAYFNGFNTDTAMITGGSGIGGALATTFLAGVSFGVYLMELEGRGDYISQEQMDNEHGFLTRGLLTGTAIIAIPAACTMAVAGYIAHDKPKHEQKITVPAQSHQTSYTTQNGLRLSYA